MNNCSKNTHNALSWNDRVIVVRVVQIVVSSSVGSDWGFLSVFISVVSSVTTIWTGQIRVQYKEEKHSKTQREDWKEKNHCRHTTLDFIVIIISLLVFAPVDHAILIHNWVLNYLRAGVGTIILQNIKFSLLLMQFYSWLTFIEISWQIIA